MPAKKKQSKSAKKPSGSKQKKTKAKAASKKTSESAAAKKPKTQGKAAASRRHGKDSFPIVGVGASAGGVQALETLFAHMPSDARIAFVIVQHLDPHHESLMNALLTKQTKLQVNDAKEGIRVEPGQVYIKPPGYDIVIRNQTIHLQDLEGGKGPRLPIDRFFRSLAEDQKEKGICIVLSGASNDGTLGAKLIKGEGGMVMVQDESQAQYPAMPRSVIDAGLADIILPVEKMPAELLRYTKHPFMVPPEPSTHEEKFDREIQGILMMVRTNTGHDFSLYKRNTVRRRIERRMALHQIHEVGDYRRYLRQNPEEVQDLFKDLTINVTSFFRDAEAFTKLKKVMKTLLQKREGEEIRVWVPGCSSGDEAYSIGIILLELAEELDRYYDIKVFGTDINEEAIEIARTGLFPENIVADVNEDRLRRFFGKKGNKYQVDSKVRDILVFAVHDITRDPPFSGMDLVSCRNLLIYMDTKLQQRVLPVLHYSLRSGGVLFLGTSETIGDAVNLFEAVDKKQKIYRSRTVETEPLHQFRMPEMPDEGIPGGIQERRKKEQEEGKRIPHEDIRRVVEQTILEKYASPAVLLDELSDIIYFHGETGRFLVPPSGLPSFNIFKMVGGDLHYKLAKGLEEARRSRKPVTMKHVQARLDDQFFPVKLVVTPLKARRFARKWTLIEFKEERAEVSTDQSPKKQSEKTHEVQGLEEQLHSTRHELQATIEELETSNEELKSANEELQANNEELQSTNEELESSKEELQSTNEELETVNSELYQKNQDLMKAEDDLNNLFSSIEIGTVFLDEKLTVKRFTPAAKKLLNLREERDLGRPISDITSNLMDVDIGEEGEEVLDTLSRKELMARGKDGNCYSIRIVPYRTSENVIEGVVVIFFNVTDLEKYRPGHLDLRGIFYNACASLSEPVVILDDKLRVFTANPAFYRFFKVTPKESLDHSIFELHGSKWDIPELRRFLEEVTPMDKEFQDYDLEYDFPRIGHRKMIVNARRVEEQDGSGPMTILSFREASTK